MTLGTRLKAQVALPKGAIPDAKLNIFKVVTQVIGSARWLQRSQMISSVVLVHCRKNLDGRNNLAFLSTCKTII